MKTFSLLDGGGSIQKYAQYLYDASGARVKKFVFDGTNYKSVTYIDGMFEYHTKSNTGEKKNYINLMGGVEVRIGSYAGDIANDIVYQIADYHGSAAIRLDDSGGKIDREEYYPYGDSSLRTFKYRRHRFIGKEKDHESGLYQMSARYYAPWMCKFLSVDPLAEKYAHQSSYCYGNCNPVFYNDPSGMEPPQQGGGNNSGSGTSYQWSNQAGTNGTSNTYGLANGGNAANTNGPQNAGGPSSYSPGPGGASVPNDNKTESASSNSSNSSTNNIQPNKALIPTGPAIPVWTKAGAAVESTSGAAAAETVTTEGAVAAGGAAETMGPLTGAAVGAIAFLAALPAVLLSGDEIRDQQKGKYSPAPSKENVLTPQTQPKLAPKETGVEVAVTTKLQPTDSIYRAMEITSQGQWIPSPLIGSPIQGRWGQEHPKVSKIQLTSTLLLIMEWLVYLLLD